MTALLVQLPEAVLAVLDAADLGQPLEWERSYGDWDLELTDDGVVHADVVPIFESEIDLETRGSVRHVFNVDIAIRKRFKTSDRDTTGRIPNGEIDPLVLLIENIAKLFVMGRPSNTIDAAWQTSQPQAWYVKKHLREWSQFTGIVRLTYGVSQDI